MTHTTCSTKRPSIAAVVGSRDPTNSLYAARLCERRSPWSCPDQYIPLLLSEYPKAGRCSLEIIKELDTMTIDLLQLFARSCGNQLPTKVIFYRDGVDDGQYQKVLDNEVVKIKHAFRGARITFTVTDIEKKNCLSFSCLWQSTTSEINIYRGEETTQHPILRLRWPSHEECRSRHCGRSTDYASITVWFLSVFSSSHVSVAKLYRVETNDSLRLAWVHLDQLCIMSFMMKLDSPVMKFSNWLIGYCLILRFDIIDRIVAFLFSFAIRMLAVLNLSLFQHRYIMPIWLLMLRVHSSLMIIAKKKGKNTQKPISSSITVRPYLLFLII